MAVKRSAMFNVEFVVSAPFICMWHCSISVAWVKLCVSTVETSEVELYLHSSCVLFWRRDSVYLLEYINGTDVARVCCMCTQFIVQTEQFIAD